MAEAMWHYSRGGQQFGPIPEEQLKQLISLGQLGPADLVWRDGLPTWVMVQSVPELGASAPPGYAPPAPVMGYYYNTALPQYAGFWLRFAAFIIDWLITTVIGCVVGGVIGAVIGVMLQATGNIGNLRSFEPLFNLIGVIVGWLYSALMESSPKQATLGKMAVGLYVTDLEGRRITFGRASGRYFGKILSMLILFIGFIMAGFTERKQALHDLIAGTLVLRR